MASSVQAARGRACWICLGDESELETAKDGPFIKLCSCTLQAHESCLLQWMLSSKKPAIACPQCGTQFVGVKKRQGLTSLSLGLRQILAAATIFGVGFVALRSIGSAYIRAVYEPLDADRILGAVPIPGLTPMANAIVKTFNSVVVAGIPYVLLQRSSLADAAVEPPLMSLAMMLMSRLDPQPTGWTSIMVAGIFHSAYRVTMDSFVIPRYGRAPIEVPDVLAEPAAPVVLNMESRDHEAEIGRAPLGGEQERAPPHVVLRRLFERSVRMKPMLLDVTRYLVQKILLRVESFAHHGDSTLSDVLQNDPIAFHTSFFKTFNAHYHGDEYEARVDEYRARCDECERVLFYREGDERLIPESQLFFIYLSIYEEGNAEDFKVWSQEYESYLGQLVYSTVYGTGTFDEAVEAYSWNMTYYQVLEFLGLQEDHDRRTVTLLRAGIDVLDTLSSVAPQDTTFWSADDYEYLLDEDDHALAVYISVWIEHRKTGFGPFDDESDEESDDEHAEVRPLAARPLGNRNEPAPIDPSLTLNAVAPTIPKSLKEWEQLSPILLFPFCSRFVSKAVGQTWPFSIFSVLNRNLVAGALVIMGNDLAQLCFAYIQRRRSDEEWHLMRLDELDQETRELVQLQEDRTPV